MSVQVAIKAANCNTNRFEIIKTPKGAFTIDADVDSIVGSPTWTFMVSNIGDIEANFKEYSPETTGMAITTAIESDKLNFEYIAIKFISNASTGTYSFYIGE